MRITALPPTRVGWTTRFLRRFGPQAAGLADHVSDYAREDDRLGLLVGFLEGLGPGISEVVDQIRTLQNELREEDPLEQDELTQRVSRLQQLAQSTINSAPDK